MEDIHALWEANIRDKSVSFRYMRSLRGLVVKLLDL